MKKSRVLALGLTAALSVSLLAGCGTGDTQTTLAPEGSTPVETGTTGAANELNVLRVRARDHGSQHEPYCGRQRYDYPPV